MKTCARSRAVRICFSILLLTVMLSLHVPGAGAARDQSNPRDFYGIVGRDPWYEYSANPEKFPNGVNRAFLENMLAGMATMGAGWIRIEFHAEYDEQHGPGRIDWSKYDWFIKEAAPKYGIKVLALLGSGILADVDKSYQITRINDPLGADGTNQYTRAFVDRAREIADHYGDSIAAYEIMNEPNPPLIVPPEMSDQAKPVSPAAYGRIVADIYRTVKPAHPQAQFVIGSLLYDVRNNRMAHLDWLAEVYKSPAIRQYVAQTGHQPLDGVAIHPYYLSPQDVLAQMKMLHELQQSHGDHSPIWITEIGLPAEPPAWSNYGIMDPTASEKDQANYLHDVYTLLRDQAPYVDRVFWFKYEDFGGAGTYANWGLVRLRDSAFRYGPDAIPWPRKDAYRVYQSLARPDAAPTAPKPAPADQGPRVWYFPETGHTLRDPFLQYWIDHGGLAMFGYPKTDVFDVAGRPVQYFERARFEYYPEFQGTPYEVQLGLLGNYVTRGRTFDREPAPQKEDPDHTYFQETGHYLSGGFRSYWQNHGGLGMFGYPISGEFSEVNPIDGKTYTVQYFERARFEYHPEFKGTEHEVLLGLLGNQVLNAPGWYR